MYDLPQLLITVKADEFFFIGTKEVEMSFIVETSIINTSAHYYSVKGRILVHIF
jgi:hypothetical protein